MTQILSISQWILGKFRAFTAFGMDVEVLLIFLALAAFALTFVIVASEVAEGDTLAVDLALLRALRTPAGDPLGPQWLRTLMLNLTVLGGVSVLTLMTAIVIGYLLIARKAALALFVLASTTSGAAMGTLLKQAFARPRPEVIPHLVGVDSLSFPSGHALNATVIYLTLGALLARSENRLGVRIYTIAVSLALAIIVGVSRVYLGVHYPTDVLAGWCAGAAWAAACSSLARLLQNRRTLELPGESKAP